MKFKISITGILLLPIMIFSCTERIDIKLDDSLTRLVVDGAITTDTMAHTVILSKTSSYYYNQPVIFVTGARVSISDGEITFDLTEKSPGIYRTSPASYGVAGHKYTINIKLKSPIGGYTDYSASSILNPITPLDSIGLEFHKGWSKNGLWEVKCYVQEPPTTDFYRFLISKNDKMLTDSLYEWFVTDDKFFNGNYTNGAAIGYLEQSSPEQGLLGGDTVKAEVNSIGKEYANFLWEAQSELWGSNPLFTGPRANVKGNIDNGAIGFFAAYSIDRAFAITPFLR
jgi:hypothetical protein